MAPRGETRQRILDAARTLFHRQGYHATGVNQILAEAAAPKGVLYFHFPGGKEQLAAETVLRSGEELGRALDAVLAQSDDLAAAARGIADLLGAALEGTQFREGCPIASVALDVAAESDQVRAACAQGYQQWIDLIAERLRQRGVPAGTTQELAVFVLSSIEGALLLARVQHDTAPLRNIAARLTDVIAAEIRPAPGR
ncbi:TetR/AcrR family transcriptional regulator [Actinomadura atramentaria]|uniref:TetR/AcrR family transcriptional regulator n=1 Tax=Actinomadura atramentaria TaxID=1990 RepID=UPI0003606878|nr:TetR/AcrR family transcriptional regulator [Actinomadura atramentaria]